MVHVGMMRQAAALWRTLARRCVPAFAVVFVLAAAGVACGQAWPDYPFSAPHAIERGPGFYLSWPKLLLLWLTFLVWVKTTDWINQDSQILDLPFAVWIPVVFFPFVVALFAAGLTIPLFAVGASITILAWLIPTLAYVFKRNTIVDPHERVMTPAHIRFLIAELLNKMGIKVASEARRRMKRERKLNSRPSRTTCRRHKQI